MKLTKGMRSRLLSIILVLALLFSLTSCFTIDLTNTASKDEIEANIAESVENNQKNYGYVADYLSSWGMPRFNSAKVKWYEAMYKRYYNYEDGLPEVFEHSVMIAELFLEELYDLVDLTDKDEVTDAILTVYSATVGDPYSIYRNAEDSVIEESDMNGEFTGIGIQVEHNYLDGTTVIVAILPNSPAETAGFEVGDHVWGVDGALLSDLGFETTMNKIRGPIGSEVTVTVKRDGELIDIKAVRDLVVEVTIEYEITEEGYGYVRVFSFKDNTSDQFKLAIEQLKRANVKGIIFDMRDNPGGYVHAAREMISYLMPTGIDFLSYNYKGGNKVVEKTEDDLVPVLNAAGEQVSDEDGNPKYESRDNVLDLPMVVICNEYTASSAEIFTSALRDYRDMKMINYKTVGQTTYKKGIMQSSIGYTDGSTATFTIAYYCPPSGVNYHGVGITPDVICEASEEGDAQYDKALEVLGEMINANNT